jgi:hypothetical protein
MNSLRDLVFNNTPAIQSLDANRVLLTLAVASVCGLVIYFIYRFFNKSVVYNANFNLLIFMVCLVTAFIIITIGANLVLSLGMVGALSIVRFRAAVKDPLDVGYLFWGVAAGLTAGAQLHLVALLGTAFISLAFVLVAMLRTERRGFLLVLRYTPENEKKLEPLLAAIKYKLKNKQQSADWVELIAEVKIKNNDVGFMKPLLESPDVISASVTEYTGEYN